MTRSIGRHNHEQAGRPWCPTLVLTLMIAAGLYSTLAALNAAREEYQAQLASELAAREHDMRRFYQAGNGALIAHGGGVGDFLYTNSAEAFADSCSKGFSFIELDILKTRDDHLLAAHDWGMFCQLTGRESEPATLNEALQRNINGTQPPLSGERIHALLRQHPELVLVMDKIADFELLLKEIPLPERMIVEVFSPQDYARALKAGVHHPAFCIAHSMALQQAIEHQYPMVTISAELFEQHLDTMRQLHEQQVCIMVYGTEELDCAAFIRKHLGSSASMIYTSSVSPGSLR